MTAVTARVRGPRRTPAAPRVPERTCVGCRAARPKRELVRVVAPAEGMVVADTVGGRMHGRGAYLCRATAAACLEQARRRRALSRALRVSAERLDYAILGAQITAAAAARETPPSPQ